MRKMTLANGAELILDNFGADPKKEGFNRYSVNLPTWDELSRNVKVHLNSLNITASGYEYAITTLTQIKSQIIQQKFYEINPSDFMPVVVGEGSFMKELVFNSVYSNGDDFETGIVDSSRPSNDVPNTDIEIIAHPISIVTWNKGFGYSVIELQQASRGNVDLIMAKEKSRKLNWDLGIQRTAFLGSKTKPAITGLYNIESVNTDTSFIGAPISSLDAAAFQTFVAGIIRKYLANCNNTTMPNTFLMPLADFVGMGAAASATFPNISKLEYLLNMFKVITANPNFKISTTAYGDRSRNAEASIDTYRYILYKNDAETLEMNIPVAYTTTAFGTPDGFNFKNIAMGQFSGVYGKHPQEILYFDDVVTA